MTTKEVNKPRKPVRDGIRSKRKKEITRSLEYQTPKSGGKSCQKKSW